MTEPTWAPDACTLPTTERPLRVAEWDTLFAGSVTAIDRPHPLLLRLTLGADVDIAAVRDLAARESDCCSFFTFTVGTTLDIEVGAAHEHVLNALQERASSIASPR